MEKKGAQEEEDIRNDVLQTMQTIKRREPLDPTYRRLLARGVVATVTPTFPRDKFYRKISSNLRDRVEQFMQQTQGKNPFDRIANRQPMNSEQMRDALTLRESKPHEQKALLEMTLSSLPRRYGMDARTRRKHLEGVALGLQLGRDARKAKPKPKTELSTAAKQTEEARRRAEREQQVAQAKQREASRIQREEEGRRDEKRKKPEQTSQQALHKIYLPIFTTLWNMEFPNLQSTNPFRLVIDKDSCASLGAPDYFDVIKTPMNLTYIQRKVEKMEYSTLQSFFEDVDLMLANALQYNSNQGDPYRQAAEDMKKAYRKIRKKIVQSLKGQQAARKSS